MQIADRSPDGPFDPAARLFLAQDRRPTRLEGILPANLSPFQRALLVTDGTVTTFLEAWALEPVVVKPLLQRTTMLPSGLLSATTAGEWLEAPAGTPVLERSVMLTGARSHKLFAFAESVICTQRLSAPMREGLLTGNRSLGQLLLKLFIDPYLKTLTGFQSGGEMDRSRLCCGHLSRGPGCRHWQGEGIHLFHSSVIIFRGAEGIKKGKVFYKSYKQLFDTILTKSTTAIIRTRTTPKRAPSAKGTDARQSR